jgi:hypothetical protein
MAARRTVCCLVILRTSQTEIPMKRDWDVIREVLLEVETLAQPDQPSFRYDVADEPKGPQALLLWKSGFLQAIDIGGLDVAAILSPTLTWAGHDLLDTLRSKPVWERIKATAKDKGIELSFDAVKMLGKAALAAVIGND